MWLYVVIAALIAATAFAVGQVLPGMGIVVVAVATPLWLAYSTLRLRRARRPCPVPR